MTNRSNQSRPCATTRVALLAVLLAGTALGGFSFSQGSRAASPVNGVALNSAPVARALPDFADLVTRVKPAVVSITVQGREVADEDEGPQMGPRMGRGGRAPEGRMSEGRGSGFITDESGTIVTNNHVVRGAMRVTVTLDDGTELPARVVGRDARTDIAVLKVSADRKLPFVQLGDSGTVRPGEWVLAMGNPFGLGGSVSAGIVSASGRNIGAGPYDQFIQVDAPINPGNSGGPLFTQDGRLIGVNSAIISPSGGSVGIGFAVPSNMVKTVVAQLERDGHVTRGYIGVQTQPVDSALAQALKVPAGGGALVATVQPDTPAARAGLRAGDVVRAVDGARVESPRDLAVAVAGVKPGVETKLDVLRNGEARAVHLTVAEMPGEERVSVGDNDSPGRQRLGLALAPLAPELRARLALPDGTDGVVVAEVEPGSPAAKAGVRPGDVITDVGGQAVASAGAAVTALKARTSEPVALRVLRDGRAMFLAVSPGSGGAGQG